MAKWILSALLLLPVTTVADSYESAEAAAPTVAATTQVIVRPAFYPPYYYYGPYGYWYPAYYYYSYRPYVRPYGAWVEVAALADQLEERMDRVRSIADDEEDASDSRVADQRESWVKEAEKASDKFDDEFEYYGVYSPSYIAILYQNLQHHMNVLRRGFRSTSATRLNREMAGVESLLQRLDRAYRRATGG